MMSQIKTMSLSAFLEDTFSEEIQKEGAVEYTLAGIAAQAYSAQATQVLDRDDDGGASAPAPAMRALSEHGCDCDEADEEEERTCLGCRCEAALLAERRRVNALEKLLANMEPGDLATGWCEMAMGGRATMTRPVWRA